MKRNGGDSVVVAGSNPSTFSGLLAWCLDNQNAHQFDQVKGSGISILLANRPTPSRPQRDPSAPKTVLAEFVALLAVAQALGPSLFPRSLLDTVPDALGQLVLDQAPAKSLASSWKQADHILVTARGTLHPVALEAALKIKEAAQLPAEAGSGADLRHGPMAAVQRGDPVLVLDGGAPFSADVTKLIGQLHAMGADVAMCSSRADAALPAPAPFIDPLAALPALVRAQQLALFLAAARGLDPDEPPG